MAEQIVKIPIEVVAPVDFEMEMSLEAFRKVAQFIIDHPEMKAGDNFTVEGTDKKTMRFLLIK